MKFPVIYIPTSTLRRLRFCGAGNVYLRDVAVLLEGEYPKFYIPTLFLLPIYQRIISATSYRTIPYSKIVHYKPAQLFFPRYHQVLFENPEGHRIEATFKVKGGRAANKFFATRFEEYLVTARTLQLS